jgi:hypothetical protein
VTKELTVDNMADVPFSQRVLLLPHCLRPSQDCPGKMTKRGLDCAGCSLADCAVYRLRTAAIDVGYNGVCVAPGGRLAIRFLAEHQPAGIIAIACDKELEEGLEAIAQMVWEDGRPTVLTFPLSQDGCVDTVVDVEAALEIILSNGHSRP